MNEAQVWGQALLREIARSFEAEQPCRCAEQLGPVTATGHKRGCPVDEAVRLDLAKAGIV